MSVETQRFLTVNFITKRRLSAETIWLKPESASEDTTPCDPNDWANLENERNMAVRLADGLVEMHIKSSDDVWAQWFFKAFPDARAAFGTQHQPISSILLRVNDPTKIVRWAENLWPKGFWDKTRSWVETRLTYSLPATKTAKEIWANSSPLPGSRFGDGLVVWRPKGRPEAEDPELGLDDLEARMLAPTPMEAVVRAIAFATLAYWINTYLDGLEDWDAILTRSIGGWIARLIREGQAINAHGKSLEGVCWAPIDSQDTALQLLAFLETLGAKRDLNAAFERAQNQLERNPLTPIPGWGSIETMFGPQAKVGIRRAFRAGLDLDEIEAMSDLYVYDRTANEYLDRDELLKGLPHTHVFDDLVGRHQNESIIVGTKAHNPFRLYAQSSLRTDVQHREFRPGYEPGALLRYSPVHGLLNGEDQHPDEYRLLNTFSGFTIKPVATIDPQIMQSAVGKLDRVLGLLTQDNDAQMLWLKKFVAHIAKYPQIKPQSCPILIGGQGIGKSVFGQDLMTALFGNMAGTAEAAALSENKFLITPFVGRLIIFIDEVKLESVGAINVIKKLVRQQYVSGQFKYKDQRDFYVPGRLMIASNSPDIGLTPEDRADRAFFFIMAATAENKRMTDREFQEWTVGLKPFYSEFIAALESVIFRQHLMRYFVDLEVSRAELEDLTHSSRNDENVVRATMSKARQVARDIVADARVLDGMDITTWFNSTMLRAAIRRVDGVRTKVEVADVMIEFERAGVIETVRGDLRKFKYRYGTILQKMGEAHALPITNNWDYKPDDYGDNDVSFNGGGNPWRGNPKGDGQKRPFDPDRMDSF